MLADPDVHDPADQPLAETASDIARHLDGTRLTTRHGPVDVHAFISWEDDSRTTVIVHLTDHDGRLVGHAERQVVDRDGTLAVYHAGYETTDHGVMGAGTGTALVHASFDAYRRAGVGLVDVLAGKIGGYAWARAGFDFEDDDVRRHAARRIRICLSGHRASPWVPPDVPLTNPGELRALATRLDSGDRTVTARQVADVGRDRARHGWHDGKVILTGLCWSGIHTL